MDSNAIIDGLLWFIGFVILCTFHEFGHAWMAWKCGDSTAKDDGRVSLNPIVHIDPIGTILMPLLMVFASGTMGQMLLGWAKPVPVNPANLRNPKIDDLLVTIAGPWMNLLLAVVLVGLARLGDSIHSPNTVEFCLKTARLSMLLFFFNLLPVPPLDGGRVVRVLIGMSYDTFAQISRYSYLIIMGLIFFTSTGKYLGYMSDTSLRIIRSWFGM